MSRFYVVPKGADGWSEWQQPVMRGYRMGCCDCGLVHDVEFRLVDGRVQLRARRNNRSTAQIRRHGRIGATWFDGETGTWMK